ncbi:MAG: DUF1684 domain-containing protein [bacterium]
MVNNFNGRLYIFFIFCLFLFLNCSDKTTPEQKRYITQIQQYRTDKDKFLSGEMRSPFNSRGNIKFHPLNYYDINFDFIFTGKVYQYSVKDTVTVYKSRGLADKFLRFGFVIFNYKNKEYKLNIYKKISLSTIVFCIWFKDKTTNKTTNKTGRYIDFMYKDDPNFLYTIDFNLSYNPDCAYNSNFSSYMPTKEDYLDIEITAGEKKFNN